MPLNSIKLQAASVSLYKNVLNNTAVSALIDIISFIEDRDNNGFVKSWSRLFSYLCETNTTANLTKVIYNAVIYDDNPFTRACQKNEIPKNIEMTAKNELKFFEDLSKLTTENLKYQYKAYFSESFEFFLPTWETSEDFDFSIENIIQLTIENGYGIFSKYKVFYLDIKNGLIPVKNPDKTTLLNLKGYEYERGIVEENTKILANGHIANNVLLYGDRGTGKSATVKALIHKYAPLGVRLIQVHKNAISELQELFKILFETPLKFIIFIDDLSFSESDDNYAALKAVLEGSVFQQPKNIAIYATSNRRHFIKESFSNRTGDEINLADTLQENASLSDRFGVIVSFLNPTPSEFVFILTKMAEDRGIDCDDKLIAGAKEWAVMKSSRTPRTAKQYLDYIIGKI